jgi:hypothetical protein
MSSGSRKGRKKKKCLPHLIWIGKRNSTVTPAGHQFAFSRAQFRLPGEMMKTNLG